MKKTILSMLISMVGCISFGAYQFSSITNAETGARVTSYLVPDGTDVLTLGSAKTNFATRTELEAGWWSEWKFTPDEGTEYILTYYSNIWTIMTRGGGFVAEVVAPEDALQLEFYDDINEIHVTATRHRIAGPTPTKPEDIGAQPAGSYASVAGATLTPIYSQTPTFSEWVCIPSEVGGVAVLIVEEEGAWEPSREDGQGGGERKGDVLSTTITWSEYEWWGVGYDAGVLTATRTRTDIIGYMLGDQTNSPLQIAGNYQTALTPQQLENIDNVTNKYTKPSSGIPKSDLSSGVQASLDLADTALQEHQSLANYYTIAETDYAINLLAAYYITMNAEGDAFPTYESLTNTATYYSGGEPRTPTRNDYAVVLADETHNTNEWRYIYTVSVADGVTNSQWEAQYPIETNDYEALANKPSIGGVELTGDKTAAELGLATDTYVNNLDTSYRRFIGLTNINQSIQYFTTTEGDGITNLVIQLPDDGETKDWVVYVNAAAELTLTLPEATWWMANPSYVNNIASNTPTALYFTQVTTGIYLLGRQELYAVPIPTPVVEEEPEPEPEQSEEPEEPTNNEEPEVQEEPQAETP